MIEPALRSYFADSTRAWREGEARVCLLGLALNWGLVAGFLSTMIADAVLFTAPTHDLIEVILWFLGGVAVGSFIAGLQKHPRRVLGMVPWGAIGLTVSLALAALGAETGPAASVILGVSFGLVHVPLAAAYQAAVPPATRGNAMALLGFAVHGTMAASAGLLWWLGGNGWSPAGLRWALAAFALAAAVLAWKAFLRETIEQLFEIPLRFMYSVRATGPGLASFPQRGPLLVVANHSAWFDPVWLAKVLPRQLIPMMTSLFYDLPVLRWLMVYVARAIRVQASTFRREVPEIQEAIDALDRGECVVVFPEGSMRRSEGQALRQFGQGIWHILKERPTTPVVVCWIEGGWGSYFSYYQGKPTKNKPMDWRRRIQVAVGPAELVPAEALQDHRGTRAFFMRKCLEARRFLGLAPLSLSAVEEWNDSPAEN